MVELINKLKDRWGITSTFQVFVILCVFTATGFSTLYVHEYIDYLLGIKEDDSFWIKLLVFVIIILPVYSILLFFWGVLFGQRIFFTRFIFMKLKLLFRETVH